MIRAPGANQPPGVFVCGGWFSARVRPMRIVFTDPRTGYEEVGVTSYTWLWVLLFGPVYFAVKANWRHCVASLILAFATFGLSWLVYPFFAKQVMLAHYRRLGWLAI